MGPISLASFPAQHALCVHSLPWPLMPLFLENFLVLSLLLKPETSLSSHT